MWRVAWIVLVNMPWASACLWMVTHLSSVTWAATSVTKVGLRIRLLLLKILWWTAGFSFLNFSNSLVQLRLLQGLFPVNLFHRSFNFLEWFPRDSESANEIGSMTYSGGGEEKRVTGRPATANQLCGWGSQNESCWSLWSPQFIFITEPRQSTEHPLEMSSGY